MGDGQLRYFSHGYIIKGWVLEDLGALVVVIPGNGDEVFVHDGGQAVCGPSSFWEGSRWRNIGDELEDEIGNDTGAYDPEQWNMVLSAMKAWKNF